MAAAPALPLSGPPQRGDSVQGQYVYALIFPQPTADIIAQTGVKQPSDFDRTTFREMVVKCLAECGIEVIETACFQEPHANGDPHLNLLVRARKQWRWKKVAERLLQVYRVHVNVAVHFLARAPGPAFRRGPRGLRGSPCGHMPTIMILKHGICRLAEAKQLVL